MLLHVETKEIEKLYQFSRIKLKGFFLNAIKQVRLLHIIRIGAWFYTVPFFQGAMNAKQIKECEGICKDIVDKKLAVFASESSLAAAKDIQGLRAIFDEVSTYLYCYRKHLEV